jgi:hypothetical protein
MKKYAFYVICLSVILIAGSCKKQLEKNVPDEISSLASSTPIAEDGVENDQAEAFYKDGVRVDASKFDKMKEPLPGEEYVSVVDENIVHHHHFSSMDQLVAWANTVPNGDQLINHLKKFDDLSRKAESTGEIAYFESKGRISENFHNYLLNGDYNYEYTPNGRNVVLGQFMKGYSSFGPSLPIFTFPHVGSGFDNDISYHQGIGIGWISIFDRSFWRKRMTTFWFVAFTARTYWGWFYDNKTTSVSTSF